MKKHDLAFLHTSPVHIATFEKLVQETAPGLRIHHVVAEELLADARIVGAEDPALAARVHFAMVDAASTGATIVVCTCSTIGGVAEQTATAGTFIATRIDRPMAERAVALGPKILVVAALESTLAPTVNLIQDAAQCLASPVDVCELLVSNAWQHFQAGDNNAYLRNIGEAITATALGMDVVVLAQASMAEVVHILPALPCEVLASPRLGVESLVARYFALVDQLAAAQ